VFDHWINLENLSAILHPTLNKNMFGDENGSLHFTKKNYCPSLQAKCLVIGVK
jgi:hypothetical protein